MNKLINTHRANEADFVLGYTLFSSDSQQPSKQFTPKRTDSADENMYIQATLEHNIQWRRRRGNRR